MVLVGLHTDVHELSWFPVIRREVVVRGANCYDRGDFARAVEWLQAGEIRPPETVQLLPLADGPAVFAELAGGRATAAKTYFELAD